jgi:hypothetical protein
MDGDLLFEKEGASLASASITKFNSGMRIPPQAHTRAVCSGRDPRRLDQHANNMPNVGNKYLEETGIADYVAP